MRNIPTKDAVVAHQRYNIVSCVHAVESCVRLYKTTASGIFPGEDSPPG